ncbi:MAG: P-loop NTPase [Clostridiales Family XIII bacterium]|nr:P-loop NTPase [Clostridiales Family XIII bacterium]
MGKNLLVTSGKGGVGKSTVALNFACALSKLNINIAIVDMNFGHRDIDFYLNLSDRIVFDISDILNQTTTLKKVAIQNREYKGIDYFPASQSFLKFAKNIDKFPAFIEEINKEYQLIVYDISFEMLISMGKAFRKSDFSFIVSTQENASLRDAESALELLKEIGIEKNYIILNQIRNEKNIKHIEGIKKSIGILSNGILAEFRYDEIYYQTLNKGILPILQKKYIFDEYYILVENFLNKLRE